jgi:hypothetical protein
MMPRGEVALIFAGAGSQLMLGRQPVVDACIYGPAFPTAAGVDQANPSAPA